MNRSSFTLTKKVSGLKRRPAWSSILQAASSGASQCSKGLWSNAFSCYKFLRFLIIKWCRVRVSRVKFILQNSARKTSKWGNLPRSVLCRNIEMIIPKVSRSFPAQNATSLANCIGDWWMTDRRAAAISPIESCTKSYQHWQHMRASTALRIDPNMWRVRCFFLQHS